MPLERQPGKLEIQPPSSSPPPPHAEANSSMIDKNSFARELKHYANLYFAYPLWCVCVGGGGGLNQWGGGCGELTEKVRGDLKNWGGGWG